MNIRYPIYEGVYRILTIYTSTIYYKRLQVTFTATLSRPGSDTKKVLKGKFMQRYPYDCSEIHHEVKDSLED